MATHATDSNTVQSVSTSLRILEVVHELGDSRVVDVTDHLDVSKSAVYKHLHTLEQEGYVVKEGETYRVGLRFLSFGEAARKRHRVCPISMPQMQDLADQTGEMSNLMVKENGQGILLYRATSDQAISLDTYAGTAVPLHCTANGKAILANLDPERVEEIVDRHGLPKFTENTITDRAELYAALEQIRERGWAYDRRERLEGLSCVSVPITDIDDNVLGAVSVSGPASRMEGERFTEAIPELLLQAQNVIEMNVAYRD